MVRYIRYILITLYWYSIQWGRSAAVPYIYPTPRLNAHAHTLMGSGVSASINHVQAARALRAVQGAIGRPGAQLRAGIRKDGQPALPADSDFAAALTLARGRYQALNRARARLYPRNPTWQRCCVFEYAHVLGYLVRASHLPGFPTKLSPASLADAIEESSGIQTEVHFLSGLFTYQLAIQWGHLAAFDTWHAKCVVSLAKYRLSICQPNDIQKQNGSLNVEAAANLACTAMHVLLMLGKTDMLAELCDVLGFSWADVTEGRELACEPAWFSRFEHATAALGTFPRDTMLTMMRLLSILAHPGTEKLTRTQALAVLVSPAHLAALDEQAWVSSAFGLAGCVHLGARLYEKLGMYGKAVETATLGIGDYNKKKVLRADCYLVLGRCLHRSREAQTREPLANQKDEIMEGYFGKAMYEARAARAYALEVVICNQWRNVSRGHPKSFEMMNKEAFYFMGKEPEDPFLAPLKALFPAPANEEKEADKEETKRDEEEELLNIVEFREQWELEQLEKYQRAQREIEAALQAQQRGKEKAQAAQVIGDRGKEEEEEEQEHLAREADEGWGLGQTKRNIITKEGLTLNVDVEAFIHDGGDGSETIDL